MPDVDGDPVFISRNDHNEFLRLKQRMETASSKLAAQAAEAMQVYRTTMNATPIDDAI